MRRIVSIVLAAAILCLALTACGSRQKTDLSKATTIADLKGAVIAGQAGTFHLDVIDQIDGVEKKSYPDFTDLLNALKSGAIDGYVAEEPTALEVCGKDDTLTYLPFVNNDTGFTATDAETGIAVAFQGFSFFAILRARVYAKLVRQGGTNAAGYSALFILQ